MKESNSTKNSKFIEASAEKLYNAFLDPKALVIWQVPGEMTGKVHDFDLKINGGYQMSLYYPESEGQSLGKTSGNEDRYTAKFLELEPFKKIVQSIKFDSSNPDFAKEMIMEATFDSLKNGTKVTIAFKNIPSSITKEDNEKGTKSSLEKLAKYAEN